MFHSVSLFSQVPLARGSRALPSVLLEKRLAIPTSPFFHLLVNAFSVIIIIIIIFINFFRRVFSEYTEAITTSLILLDNNFLRNVLLSLFLAVLCGLK